MASTSYEDDLSDGPEYAVRRVLRHLDLRVPALRAGVKASYS
jgi:hypothetical protein